MSGSIGTPFGDTPAREVPGWLWVLAMIAAMLTTAQSLGVSYMGSGWAAPRGATGMIGLKDCESDRFCALSSVAPASPAANAGIVPSDRVKLDRYWERHRTLSPGERIGITVRSNGHERHVVLVTTARPYYAPTWIIDGLASAAICLIALLILARAGDRWWSFLLGASLVSVGIPGGYPRFWQNEPALFPWFFAGLAIAYMTGPILLLAALRGFRRSVIGHSPQWLDLLLWSAGAVVLAAVIWGTAVELDSAPVFGLANGLLLTSLTWSATSLLGPLALAAGWRDVPVASRTRYLLMWTAVSVSSVHPIVDPLIIAAGNNYDAATWPVIVQLGSTILGAALFAYAILRHRVVDLGFAINRTLVYSVLSFLTLLVFGLVEWASEKFLPIGSHEASAVIEAGVALTLFLVFHHIHTWVEQLVERLFFHRWHANETSLRRFMHQASYISSADVLLGRVAGELERFSGGAAVGVYRAGPGGYEFAAGRSPCASPLDTDSPSVLALRADRTVVRDGDASGDIWLPMVHRAELIGFVVLGPKPDGDPYRIDEETLLAETVNRIGLDLHALRVEELEELNAMLLKQLEATAEVVGDRCNPSKHRPEIEQLSCADYPAPVIQSAPPSSRLLPSVDLEMTGQSRQDCGG